MTKKIKISQEDIDAWKNYTKNPTGVVDKDISQNNKQLKYNRFTYDLHGFTLLEANERVKEIISSCVKKGYEEILLITGKGNHSNTDKDIYVSKDLSKLKFSVPEFINNNNELNNCVFSITEASSKDGGTGAILIKLKNL